MLYRSTRGHPNLLTFEQAVLQGLAPDGGLYIPTSIPQLSLPTILSYANLPFHQLAFNLYRPYISQEEIPDADLLELCRKSFATFSHPAVTPLVKLPDVQPTLKNSNTAHLYVLELFHGPTFAFKDVALQFLGNVFEYFLVRKNKQSKKHHKITVVGATSGDTGGAAIYGLRGKKDIEVFILHPYKRISPVQELQMTSVLDRNVHNVAVEGSFDDCQDIVKALFSEKSFKETYQLGAVNSINWARILAQTTYYFFSYFQLLKERNIPLDTPSLLVTQRVQYSVPSGNFGDVLAGFYAKQMGLPVDRFIIATNENDILDRFLKTGSYSKQATGSDADPVRQTLSPAMDILISSNFERLLWYLMQSKDGSFNKTCSAADANEASGKILSLMTQLKQSGGFSVPPEALKLARSIFASHRVDDATTTDCIKRYYHCQYSNLKDRSHSKCYILDPHTAVGVVAAEHLIEKEGGDGIMSTICLSTASPGKFPSAVLGAINDNPPPESNQKGFKPLEYANIAPKTLVELEGLPQRFVLVKTRGEFKNALRGVRQTVVETLRTTQSRL